MTVEGADGGFNMIGAGRSEGDDDIFRGFVIPPSNREFRDGDLALLEISPCLNGYFAQTVRLFSFGEPPSWIKEFHAACIHAKNKALAAFKPENSYVQVGEAIRDGLSDKGCKMKGVGSAHTIGLDLSESIINLVNPGEVEEGQILTMHPMVEIGDWRQLFVGETYIAESDGVESLTKFGDEIVRV
jgi:Xaa-Pro aminopeptidase